MIHKPFKGFLNKDYPDGSVTQWFSENPELYSAISTLGLKAHNGIDIVAPWGTPIMCVEDGIVADVKDTPEGYGMHIRIITENEGENHEWTYGHLSSILCKRGDRVKAGDIIGKCGNTGFVVSGHTPYWKYNPFAGTHLHLGLRLFRYTPGGWSYPYMTRMMTTLNYDNGYLGGVDFKDMLPTFTEGAIEDLNEQGFTENWQKLVYLIKKYLTR